MDFVTVTERVLGDLDRRSVRHALFDWTRLAEFFALFDMQPTPTTLRETHGETD